jgi:predicted ABC-type transport system involved in lysophospholipase L1 biosynthesis ATPase subunit
VLEILKALTYGNNNHIDTHDMAIAAKAKRMIRLKDGIIVEDTGRYNCIEAVDG